MRSDWPVVALTEIYQISSGLSKPADSFGSGYPFLSFKDVFGNYFLPDELSQLVESTEKEREKGSIKRGDVFLTRTSETMHELGMSSIALKDYPEATFNGFTKRLRPKEDAAYEVYPEFIGYFLRSQKFRRGMLAFSTMSTRASLNNDMISRLTVELPPIDAQKNIAKVLKALDDKIELNRQTNQTLEHIAQAIFKSWFVDFDPTRAKIAAKQAGQDPERAAMAVISGKALDELDQLSSEQLEQLKTTAALFPDALVDSELGEVPEGWEVKNIEQISTNVAMGPFGSNIKVDTFVNEGIPIINGQQLKSMMLADGENRFVTHDHADKLIKSNVYRGDIVITHRGTLGQVSIIPEGSQYDRYIVSQSQCYIRPDKELISPLFLIFYFQSYIGQHELLAHKSQVGVPSIAKPVTNIRKIELVVPKKDILDEFQVLVSSLQVKISKGVSEIATLEAIRDSLLPKLLSGELSTESKEAV